MRDAIIVAAATLLAGALAVPGVRRALSPRRARLVIWLDRNDWAFVVENRGGREARSVVVTALRAPRGRVTVPDLSRGHKVPVLPPGASFRLAVLREHLSAAAPAVIQARWTDPNGKERRTEAAFYG